jgi:hypothetical protein
VRALLLTVGVTTVLSVARGDMPLPPPSKVVETSPNGRIQADQAVSDPKTGTQIVDVNGGKVLWSLPDWYRSIYVADDGKHIVTEYNGMNLIPVDFRDDLVLLTFWSERTRIRQVTVKDVFPDRKGLQRTSSHYAWRLHIDFDRRGRLRVTREDGKTLLFDVSTGNSIQT